MRASKKNIKRAGLAAMLLGLVFCVNKESDYLQPTEANLRVLLAFQIKDEMCGSRKHDVNTFVFAPTREESVTVCVLGILDTTCAAWEKEDPTPIACKGLIFDLTL